MASGVEYVSTPGEWASRESTASRVGLTVRELAGVLAATSVAAVALALLTTAIAVPTIFGDELRYWEAARSLASGDGLSIRGGEYGYGPVYPFLLAPILSLVSSPDAFLVAKLLNALLFAAAAVPLYLIARRLLDHTWSLVVALLSILLPASVYAGFILTESVAYLGFAVAALASVLVFERTTVWRQLAALGAIGLVTAARPQLAVLGGALLIGYCMCFWLRPRYERRRFMRDLWPTLLFVLAMALGVGYKLVTDGGAALGGYSDLASTELSPLAGIVWTWWTIGALVLSLAGLPALLLPAVLHDLRGRAALRSTSDAAFLAALVSITGVVGLSVGFFSSTKESLQIMHERYFFYLMPLWLLAVAVWARHGGVVRRRHLIGGALLAFFLLSTIPPGLRKNNSTVWFEWPSNSPWVLLDSVVPIDGMAFSAASAVVVIVLALVFVRMARLRPMAALVPIALAFACAGTVAWAGRSATAHIDRAYYGAAFGVDWVDAAVGPNADVTTFFTGSRRCMQLDWKRPILYTEFDNASVGRAVHLREASAPVIESTAATIGPRGIVQNDRGRPIQSRYVLAPLGVGLAGQKVAVAPDGRVTLWAVNGTLRVEGASSTLSVLRPACPPGGKR